MNVPLESQLLGLLMGVNAEQREAGHLVFKPSSTFKQPASNTARQQGFAPIGSGQQFEPISPGNYGGLDVTVFGPSALDYVDPVPWTPKRPIKGKRSWRNPSGAESSQRGYPSPEDMEQARPPGTLDAYAPAYGGNIPVWTPYYDRGAAAVVQNYGKVLYNPIGAGVVALQRPQASYGESGQYADGAIWWTSQVIPTTIAPQSLTDPQELTALLSDFEVQAVYRTTG